MQYDHVFDLFIQYPMGTSELLNFDEWMCGLDISDMTPV